MQFVKKYDLKQYLKYILLFIPISISGFSTNYLFIYLFINAKFILPKDQIIILFLFFMFFSYTTGIFLYSGEESFFLVRQLVSFLLFLALYLLLFIEININLDKLLKAVVLVSILYSIHVLYVIFTNNSFSLSDIYFIKGGLREYVSDWPQRYVVLLVFAFMISFSFIKKNGFYLVSTVLIGITIIFTFTRSAYLALFVAMIVYILRSLSAKSKISYKSILYFLIFIISLYYLIITENQILEGLTKIILRLTDAIELFFSSGGGHEGSDNDRLSYWMHGFTVLEKNIISGTGFAGIYLFYPEIGSMHSQYMDVFLRLGVIGILFYLYLWFKLFKFYYRYSVPIFSGLVAIFIFGFSHETTKLTYVGLLFFLLLNYAINFKEEKCAE